MYEYNQGSARLVFVLEDYAHDPDTVRRLARILDYCPDQLAQDIQALADFYADHQAAGQVNSPGPLHES